MAPLTGPLADLADAHGVALSYRDEANCVRECSIETAVAILRVLGVPLDRPEHAADVLRETRLARWQQAVDPVAVAWDGSHGRVVVRTAGSLTPLLRCELEAEGGHVRTWDTCLADLDPVRTETLAGERFAEYHIPLPARLTLGYHRFRLLSAPGPAEALVIAAPTEAYQMPGADRPAWGVFLPLYTVRRRGDLGIGDFTSLERLQTWCRGRGGRVVGTLPLTAAFLHPAEGVVEPSPYSPASRLFWNEVFLDLTRIPELAAAPATRARMASAAFRREAAALRRLPLVDYLRVMALKRGVLAELAEAFFANPGDREEAFERYRRAHPQAEDYAHFRAACERFGTSWWDWPDPAKAGRLDPADLDPRVGRYHLFAQWQAHEQLTAAAAGKGLYLDLPLGPSPDSYDVWQERGAFALGASVGAPPDAFAAAGQRWGLPPFHPERTREQGYRYFREVLAHLMPVAGSLRIDHLVGLHRLFVIPDGMTAAEGAFVRCPWPEFYAILCLEAHRHRTALVGEDLGLVPPEVRPAMERHRIDRIFVAQYQDRPHHGPSAESVPAAAVASLNTHDLAPFAAFWRGHDLTDRRDAGIITADGCRFLRTERAKLVAELRAALGPPPVEVFLQRKWRGVLRRMPACVRAWWDRSDEFAVLRNWLVRLGESEARVVLVNLEDLWQCPDPQNVPGTWTERPNWRRRAWYALEQFNGLRGVRTALTELHAARPVRSGVTDQRVVKVA